jgi:hypothetical protein
MVVCGLFTERPEEEIAGEEACMVAAGADTSRDAAMSEEPIPGDLIAAALRDEVAWVADMLDGPASECEEVATPIPAIGTCAGVAVDAGVRLKAAAGLVEDTTS